VFARQSVRIGGRSRVDSGFGSHVPAGIPSPHFTPRMARRVSSVSEQGGEGAPPPPAGPWRPAARSVGLTVDVALLGRGFHGRRLFLVRDVGTTPRGMGGGEGFTPPCAPTSPSHNETLSLRGFVRSAFQMSVPIGSSLPPSLHPSLLPPSPGPSIRRERGVDRASRVNDRGSPPGVHRSRGGGGPCGSDQCRQ